jgi:hypothetical protein
LSFPKEKLQDLAASIENDDPVNRVNTLLGKLNSVVNNQNKQSTIFESRLQQVHKFMNPIKKIFKNLPKRLEWKCFYVNDLPIIMEICEDIRQISLENQLNKSQVKAISEVKKISAKAFQDIVNIGKLEKSSQNDSQKNDLKKASNVPLQEMSAREIKPNERLAHWASSVSSVHTSLANDTP